MDMKVYLNSRLIDTFIHRAGRMPFLAISPFRYDVCVKRIGPIIDEHPIETMLVLDGH